MTSSARRSRGSILVMSLVVVTIGALVGTSIIYYAGSDRRAAQMGVSRVQVRAMAWSGVQAAMAELGKQREALLSGEAPEVTEQWIAPAPEGREAGGARWGFRILPVSERTVWSEMGKLDVNTAPAEVLAKLPGLTEQIAGRIVARRAERRWTSIAELLGVEGLTYDVMYGAPGASSQEEGNAEVPSEAAVGVSGAPAAGGLHRYLTVYSFDPEVQVGFGAKASDAAGKQRININVAWSEELGKAIEERFDKGIADGVKGLIEGGEKFEKPSTIVKKLREFRVDPEGWPEILDAFTTNPDQFRMGTVDLLTAPAVVLRCVPGITPEAATEIVERREKLDGARRGTVAWPVLEDIVKPEEFELAVDYLTSRSMQWRVVVEGGLFLETGDGVGAEGAPDWELGDDPDALSARPQPLAERVVYEAVIDVSSLRARVAYLREVTFLPTARMLAAADAAGEDREPGGDQMANAEEERNSEASNQSLPDGFHTELDSRELERQRLDEGRDLDTPDLGSHALDREKAEEELPAPSGAPPVAQDRRVGRWTPGSGGSK
jgi:DNA uptake protein ComE-like DNA-binding protein